MIKTYLKQLKQNGSGVSSYLDMIMCTLQYGASPNNYKNFGFKELNNRERSTYVTNGLSRKIIKKFNDPAYIDFLKIRRNLQKGFLSILEENGFQLVYCIVDI